MDKMYFDQIISQNNAQAMKLYNSSYLEELTGLFEKSASLIDTGSSYYFSSRYYLNNPTELPDSSFELFIKEFKNSFDYSSSQKVNIIIGYPGVGKTLFFNKGIQMLLRDNGNQNDKYIKLGIDFKNIDAMEKTEDYIQFIYSHLKNNAIDAIRQLKNNEYSKFSKKYKSYCDGLYDTPFACFYPIYYFCESIYKIYKKPGIIILDNIDLADRDTQEKVFMATANISEEFCDFMKTFKAEEHYRIYFAMRPETLLQNKEMKIGKIIEFPLPNIQAISLEVIKNSLIKTAKNLDKNSELNFELTYYDIITNKLSCAKKYMDIANYFNAVLIHFFGSLWSNPYYTNRLGNCQDFHCYIVNYNIRLFLNFLSDTLTNGGFKPLTKDFTKDPYSQHYNLFDYIEMIIKGRWQVYPGIRRINNEGGNKAPIVFNVFDTSLYRNTQEIKIKHFLLYVYILEVLNEKDENNLIYGTLEEELSLFFDKAYIYKAMQELIFVRMVYSDEGDKSISNKKSYEEILITSQTTLHISKKGAFYIEKFICEFEYLYQMSLTSLMPSDYVEKLKNCWVDEKEQTVLYFLKGIFEILKININRLNEDELCAYINTFCIDNKDSSRTFRRMLMSYIGVIEKKLSSAESRESKNIFKLKQVLNEANELKKEVFDYFKQKLDDC